MKTNNDKGNGEKYILEWLPAPFIPPRELTIQSGGICFTENQKIILVNDGKQWSIPGGRPEENESLEQALVREIAEEACAEVVEYQYIGCIKTSELYPELYRNMPVFYKARYWARVKINTFNPQFETIERIEVLPQNFENMLGWNAKKTAKAVLEAALCIEKEKLSNE
jgi:hypothetical protein